MSLRARITFFNTALVGGVILLFGLGLYWILNQTLLGEIDKNLTTAVNGIVTNSKVSKVGDLEVLILPKMAFETGVYVQYWDRSGNLSNKSVDIAALTTPLDEDGLEYRTPVNKNVTIEGKRFRVRTTPLFAGERKLGTLMTAMSIRIVDLVNRSLMLTLSTATIFVMALVSLISWLSMNRALTPLYIVMDAAFRITKADDLSLRIPETYAGNDEIGGLIKTYNDTMARVESMLNSQQRFLADVSHEFRTPLTVIKGNAELIERFGADEEAVSTIKLEIDRLTRMVEDLLLLAQADAGRLTLNYRNSSVEDLIVECVKNLKVLSEKKVHVRIDITEPISAMVDPDRIKQVLINLISNAISYSPVGSEVSIHLERNADNFQVRVIDNGPGIAEEDLKNIFDRFYRGEKARTRSARGGYGLGLAIASKIVDLHHGEIQVESVVGKGTTFIMRLPIENQGINPS